MLQTTLLLSLSLSLAIPTSALSTPSIGYTWDYPLGYTLTSHTANSSTHFYSVDLFNTAASDVSALKTAGHYVACYFSGGSVETGRPDDNSTSFPPAAVGKIMNGWPDEKWLDTRNSVIRQTMVNRIALARSKGCDGVDVDDIDGYENETGFDLAQDDAVSFVKAMAKAAHNAGLAYGLKNGGDLVGDVLGDSDWAINEQCVQYDECDSFAPFFGAGKPVFHVEYTADDEATSVSSSDLKRDCAAGGQTGFSSIVKHMSLDKFVISCA